MRWSKKPAMDSGGGDADRLSDFPDSLICQVLYYLPTKEAVATSILAKRWRFLWTHVPNLVFDFSYSSFRDVEHDYALENFNSPEIEDYAISEYRDIRYSYLRYGAVIRNVMYMHNVVDLDDFRLSYCLLEFSDYDFDEFVGLAVERGVKNLEIRCVENHVEQLSRYYYGNRTPVSMLNCRSLVTLRLRRCFLWIPCDSTVCLPSLRDICLEEMLYPQSESLPRLISGCPALEELTLRQVDVREFLSWSICSETLKCLNIVYSLEWAGHEVTGYSLDACDDVFGWDGFEWGMETPSLVCMNLRFYSIRDANLHVPFSFLGNVPSVKRLKLHCNEVNICSVIDLIPPRELDKLEVLDFSAHLSFLMVLFKYADNLKHLKVRQVGGRMRRLRLPKRVPECMVTHLKTVEFMGFEFSKIEFRFLEYILTNGLVLEKVTVCCYPYSVTGSKGMKKLEAFLRTSNKVQFHVRNSDFRSRCLFGCDVLSV